MKIAILPLEKGVTTVVISFLHSEISITSNYFTD